MNVNLTPLKDNDIQYDKAVSSVENSFKCAWDDAVHDSYSRYVRQLGEYSERIRTVRCTAETLEKEAEGLNVEELKKQADRLCREADSI